MDETVVIKLSAVEKINFVLDDHQKLINMCKVPDVIKHSLHKDVVVVRNILKNTEPKKGE